MTGRSLRLWFNTNSLIIFFVDSVSRNFIYFTSLPRPPFAYLGDVDISGMFMWLTSDLTFISPANARLSLHCCVYHRHPRKMYGPKPETGRMSADAASLQLFMDITFHIFSVRAFTEFSLALRWSVCSRDRTVLPFSLLVYTNNPKLYLGCSSAFCNHKTRIYILTVLLRNFMLKFEILT